jgi:hypothetical protein
MGRPFAQWLVTVDSALRLPALTRTCPGMGASTTNVHRIGPGGGGSIIAREGARGCEADTSRGSEG